MWSPQDKGPLRTGNDWRDSTIGTNTFATSFYNLREFIGQNWDAAWNTNHAPLIGHHGANGNPAASHGPSLRHIHSSYQWRGADFAFKYSATPTILRTDGNAVPTNNNSVTNTTAAYVTAHTGTMRKARTDAPQWNGRFLLMSWNHYKLYNDGTPAINAARGDGSTIQSYKETSYFTLVNSYENWWTSPGWSTPGSRDFYALDEMFGITDVR